MSEFADVCKVIIEKTGFKTLIFSIAVSLTANKLWINDWVWTIVLFCVTYLIVCLTIYLKDKYYCFQTQKELDQKEKENDMLLNYQMNTFFNSLPEDVKKNIIILYNLPKQDQENVRILIVGHHDCDNILNACWNVRAINYVFDVKDSIDSYIITIEEHFYYAIEKYISKNQ